MRRKISMVCVNVIWRHSKLGDSDQRSVNFSLAECRYSISLIFKRKQYYFENIGRLWIRIIVFDAQFSGRLPGPVIKCAEYNIPDCQRISIVFRLFNICAVMVTVRFCANEDVV